MKMWKWNVNSVVEKLGKILVFYAKKILVMFAGIKICGYLISRFCES